MNPILFDKNTTDFSTNGIGRLSDAISCIVTEERNGIYELEMKYPITGHFYSQIRHSNIIYAIPSDGEKEQAFRIYKISKPIDGIVTVNAEHISYQLSHIPVSPFKAQNVSGAFEGLKNNAAEDCPFTFWTDKTTAAVFEVTEPVSIRSRLGGVQGSILDVYGGEYKWDMYTVKLYAKRGNDNGVTIRYGKNLIDLKQEETIENTITGIYPYWKDSESMISLPEKTISADNEGNYPYKRTIPMDFSSEFDEKPSEEQLRNAAKAYIKNNNIGIPSVSISVEFQPLWNTDEYKDIAQLERVKLCDTVTVFYEELGVNAKAEVNKTQYDVLLERYKTIDLGDARSNLATTIASQEKLIEEKPSVSFLMQAVESATSQITGNKGGYVVFRYDGNGNPYEILIMDKPSIEEAQNVWRFNQAGLGHSSNGYNGPYSTAITQDGHIVADFITTGTMLANIIKGGIFSVGGIDNESGIIQVLDKNGNVIGKWTKDGIEILSGTIKGVSIESNNAKITGGSILMETDSSTIDFITLNYKAPNGQIRSIKLSSTGIFAESNDAKTTIAPGNVQTCLNNIRTSLINSNGDISCKRFGLINDDESISIGATGTFNDKNGKTVTVKGGIITYIS